LSRITRVDTHAAEVLVVITGMIAVATASRQPSLWNPSSMNSFSPFPWLGNLLDVRDLLK
jgi:hypothetical protein